MIPVELVCDIPDYTHFCGTLRMAGSSFPDLASALNSGNSKWTVFVPNDNAYAKMEDRFDHLTDEVLERIMMFHFYPGTQPLTYDELECGKTLMSESGDSFRTKCRDGVKYQNGGGNTKIGGDLPLITTHDVEACDTILHGLDHFMLPVALLERLMQPIAFVTDMESCIYQINHARAEYYITTGISLAETVTNMWEDREW